jgi:hypothetical protein
MILSRAWLVLLSVFAALSFYVVSLAVGQYNRQVTNAADEELKSDTQVVGWALQIDARRRLDNLLLATVDENVRKALKAANGKESIPAPARDDGRKGVQGVNEKLPADYKFDAIFVVDREGRVVSQFGYDAANNAPDFELGGYPAVFDALHGYLRDDNWAFENRLFRVVARPVEDEVGQPPLGAIVALKNVDADYCRELSKRTRSNVAFFIGGAKVASGGIDTFPAAVFDELSGEYTKVRADDGFKTSGRSDVRAVGPKKDASAVFSRLTGDAGETGAGFAVARQRVLLSGMMGFLSGADDTDKKNVSYVGVLGILLLGVLLGIGFTVFEHTLPMREFGRQAQDLRGGKLDTFQLARLRAGYRAIAQAINQGVERIVEKGGGTARKPADLEAILGPVPAQPQMSAFSFPLPEPSAPASAGGAGGVGGVPGAPPSQAAVNPPAARAMPPAPKPPIPAPKPAGLPGSLAQPPSGPGMGAGAGARAPSANLQAAPAAPASAPNAAPTPAPNLVTEPEDEATKVGAAPQGVIRAASGSVPPPAMGDDPPEWRGVFEEFVKTKRQCGESVEGLTYEKFRGTLAKNRDALIQRHNCTRVKFSVYIKEGKASLKATPVRD